VSRRLLTKGVLRFEGEDGRDREVEVELYSDETFRLADPPKPTQKERKGTILLRPAEQLPASVAHEALANVVRRRLEEGKR